MCLLNFDIGHLVVANSKMKKSQYNILEDSHYIKGCLKLYYDVVHLYFLAGLDGEVIVCGEGKRFALYYLILKQLFSVCTIILFCCFMPCTRGDPELHRHLL